MIKFPCRGCGKAVGTNHHAIECDICHAWIHTKCNKFDNKDYTFYQDNPDAPFYCIVCCSENIPFSHLNNNLFSIAVEKGVNFLIYTDVRIAPSANEQRFLIGLIMQSTIMRLILMMMLILRLIMMIQLSIVTIIILMNFILPSLTLINHFPSFT